MVNCLAHFGPWSILDTGAASAHKNMAIDEELLHSQSLSPTSEAILHFYDWVHPSATYGYFTDPNKLLCPEGVMKESLDLGKRPTGGGIIFHVTDFAFSMIVPASHIGYSTNILDNYAFVNAIVIQVVKTFLGNNFIPSLLPLEPAASDKDSSHFCMAKPTKYDVMLNGRKVGGGAQRRTKHGFLHQGTISLALPSKTFLTRVLKPGTKVLESMEVNTYALLPGSPDRNAIHSARKSLKLIFSSLAA